MEMSGQLYVPATLTQVCIGKETASAPDTVAKRKIPATAGNRNPVV